jgi:hypothetical protein
MLRIAVFESYSALCATASFLFLAGRRWLALQSVQDILKNNAELDEFSVCIVR